MAGPSNAGLRTGVRAQRTSRQVNLIAVDILACALSEWHRIAHVDIGQKMVPGGGIEPPTQRFSVACSTN
jgi:hypothetical protein